MRIGFIINPIAGMGGKVGLKGTDGVVEEAIKRGAKSIAEKRGKEFIRNLKDDIEIYTCSPPMGKNVAKSGIVIYEAPDITKAEDTKKAAKKMMSKVDLIVFVGGDGTACDIFEVVKQKVAILGVPSGVKMYSAIFAYTPKDAAEIVNEFDSKVEEREIMDIDEEAFRKGEFKVKIKGYAFSPIHEKVQAGKEIFYDNGKEEIAQWFLENMDEESVYIIGGGSTTWEIKRALGIDGSFLGIDVVKGRKLLYRDAGEREIMKFLKGNAKIIISPLGKQGFIFGRGNQPISDEVIKKVGRKNIIIVSTKSKLNRMKSLKVDTGNEEVNEMLRGFMEVIVGYNEKKIMRVE